MTRHALALALALVACSVGDIELAGRQCPCVNGYRCDSATNTCVPTPGGADGGFADGSGDGGVPPVEGGPRDGAGLDGPAPDGTPDGPLGGDAGPPPVVIASMQGAITAMTIDATAAYWATLDPMTTKTAVVSAPLAGGATSTLATGLDGVNGMAQTADGVYLFTTGATVTAIQLVAKSGGTPPTSLWTGSPGYASDLATDGTSVYFGASPSNGPTSVYRVAAATGATLLASGSFVPPTGMAVSGATLYWSEGSGSIRSLPTTGGAPTVFLANFNAEALTAYAGVLYSTYHTSVSCNDRYSVSSITLPGAAPTLLSHGVGKCLAITAGPNGVYCADIDNGVRRITLTGSSDTLLGGAAARAVAIDATYVYWADNGTGGGSILKLAQ